MTKPLYNKTPRSRADARAWFHKKRFLAPIGLAAWAVAVAVVAPVIAGEDAPKDERTTAAAATADDTAAAAPEAQVDAGAATGDAPAQAPAGTEAPPEQTESTDPEPTTAPEQKKPAASQSWQTVATVKGTSDLQSKVFALSGGKVRVVHDFKDTSGTGQIIGAVYFIPEGKDVMTNGKPPVVEVAEPGSGEGSISADAGNYYLQVSGVNASYTVTVQELK